MYINFCMNELLWLNHKQLNIAMLLKVTTNHWWLSNLMVACTNIPKGYYNQNLAWVIWITGKFTQFLDRYKLLILPCCVISRHFNYWYACSFLLHMWAKHVPFKLWLNCTIHMYIHPPIHQYICIHNIHNSIQIDSYNWSSNLLANLFMIICQTFFAKTFIHPLSPNIIAAKLPCYTVILKTHTHAMCSYSITLAIHVMCACVPFKLWVICTVAS